mmetsp:Transcript_76051/g.219598  ORF Transcript_76051/g.219598 Transcript_76051/m.219598 type:complete len:212 (+) Transcript_76051:251-886(+)
MQRPSGPRLVCKQRPRPERQQVSELAVRKQHSEQFGDALARTRPPMQSQAHSQPTPCPYSHSMVSDTLHKVGLAPNHSGQVLAKWSTTLCGKTLDNRAAIHSMDKQGQKNCKQPKRPLREGTAPSLLLSSWCEGAEVRRSSSSSSASSDPDGVWTSHEFPRERCMCRGSPIFMNQLMAAGRVWWPGFLSSSVPVSFLVVTSWNSLRSRKLT